MSYFPHRLFVYVCQRQDNKGEVILTVNAVTPQEARAEAERICRQTLKSCPTLIKALKAIKEVPVHK